MATNKSPQPADLQDIVERLDGLADIVNKLYSLVDIVADLRDSVDKVTSTMVDGNDLAEKLVHALQDIAAEIRRSK